MPEGNSRTPGRVQQRPRGLGVLVDDLEGGAQLCRQPSPVHLPNNLGHTGPRIWASDVQLPAMLRAGSDQGVWGWADWTRLVGTLI